MSRKLTAKMERNNKSFLSAMDTKVELDIFQYLSR